MAKNDKYLQYAKSRKKTQLHVDLQQLAVEYSRLLNKKFCYVFSGGIEIQFQFKMENFSDLGEIKTHRFQFFSETQVLELLRNDPVIDFDKEECETDIEADKVFFKLIAEKSRNLNLFVGYDDDVKRHFVSTFFVEMEKDKFLIKKDGDSQPLLKILSRKVIDTQNNAVIDFFIKWHNVRGEFVNESFYRGQTRLKTWINDKHISSKQVLNEIDTQRKLLAQYKEEVEQLRVQFDVLELIEQLDIPEEKEEAQLKLMEYNIDADNAEDLEAYKQCDKFQAKSNKLKMENKLAALENKLQKHEKYLPDIKELELQEVLRAYQVYLPAIKLDRERVNKVLESQEIFDKTLFPEEFETFITFLFAHMCMALRRSNYG